MNVIYNFFNDTVTSVICIINIYVLETGSCVWTLLFAIDLTTGKVSSFLIKFKSSAFKQHRGLFVVLWSRSYLFRIERRHWRICTSPLTSDSNLNWSETERTPSFSVYRTFLQRAIYMWEFEPLKLLGPFSLGCLSAGIQNAKKKTHAYVRPRFMIERVRSVFLTDFLRSIYTSRRSRRTSSFIRVHPSDIDLTLFSISLFFCHAEHRKASPNSLRFYGFWQVTSDRFYFNLKCRRISAHTRSQIFLPHLYKDGPRRSREKDPSFGYSLPRDNNWDNN